LVLYTIEKKERDAWAEAWVKCYDVFGTIPGTRKGKKGRNLKKKISKTTKNIKNKIMSEDPTALEMTKMREAKWNLPIPQTNWNCKKCSFKNQKGERRCHMCAILEGNPIQYFALVTQDRNKGYSMEEVSEEYVQEVWEALGVWSSAVMFNSKNYINWVPIKEKGGGKEKIKKLSRQYLPRRKVHLTQQQNHCIRFKQKMLVTQIERKFLKDSKLETDGKNYRPTYTPPPWRYVSKKPPNQFTATTTTTIDQTKPSQTNPTQPKPTLRLQDYF
jgi:hypothetical protein